MKCSRRDFGLLLPSLAAAQAVPASNVNNDVEHLPVMKTERFAFDEIPVTTNGKNAQRRMFTAKTHTGFKIESHQSDIAPGEVNHAPHQHRREEMMLIRDGVMELTIAGTPYRLGPGDVGVIGSNELHNAKNVGPTTARYFIVNIGRDDV